MYRIMYRAIGMKRFVSAVTLNDAEDALVEARFASKEVAEQYRVLWFEKQKAARMCLTDSRVERVPKTLKCEWKEVA